MFKKVKTRLFSRYLFSIFCVVAIAVILVTLLIFTIYANLQVSSARTYSVHQLEQVCQMTDMLYNQMHSVNNQILQNSNTNRCLSSNTFNRLIEADAGIKLREIQTAQSYTRYVSLYNSRYECKSDNHREPVNSHVPLSNSAPFLEAILGL